MFGHNAIGKSPFAIQFYSQLRNGGLLLGSGFLETRNAAGDVGDLRTEAAKFVEVRAKHLHCNFCGNTA
jgi:hypothetical protein